MNKKRFFFINPRWLIITLPILTFCIITYKYFFGFSNTEKQEHFEAKSDLTLFFENIMIREGGLYTLIGTKPITEFDIEGTVEETEEEIFKSYNELIEFEQKTPVEHQAKSTFPTYEEYRLKCTDNREKLRSLNYKKLWESYLEKRYSLDPKYRIFSRKAPYGEEKMGLFLSIPNLVYILHHYYGEFSLRTGIDFEPNAMVLQIDDESSIFWDKVFKDHYLAGIIFGYGERSSYLYDWSDKNLKTIHDERREFFSNEAKVKNVVSLIKKHDIQPSDLLLPDFFHFGITEPKKIEYEIERKKIIEHFNNREFTNEVMKILKAESDGG